MLVLEIAAGIVLGVVSLFVGIIFFGWVASWSSEAKLAAVIVIAVLIGLVYEKLSPDKKTSPITKTAQPETRAHFAARYKGQHPEYANMPDEELVKLVLHDHPEACSLVEGGCK
jgi:hypothetical protein